jgi:glc operon protein GlcG
MISCTSLSPPVKNKRYRTKHHYIFINRCFKTKAMLYKFLITQTFCFFCTLIYAQDLRPALNFSTAQKITEGCIVFADSGNLKMAIAVFDAHAQLISFARMDGASVGSAKVAQWKGLSASTYQFSTEQTGKWNVPTAPDISNAVGGLPIFTKEGHIIGAVGVSGSAASIDAKCAETGIRAAGLFSSFKKE